MNTGWRKSTFSSDNAHCVKIHFDGSAVLVGDTKHAHLGDSEPVLRLPANRWRSTLANLPRSRDDQPMA